MKDKGTLGTIGIIVVAIIVLVVIFAWGKTDKKEETTKQDTTTTEEATQTTDESDAGKLGSNEVEITAKNFEEKIVKGSAGKLVVVDVYAPWCPHCQKMGPVITALADENVGKVVFGKMNANNQDEAVKENYDYAIAKGLEGYPTIWFYKDGKEVYKFSGEKAKADIQTEINKYK